MATRLNVVLGTTTWTLALLAALSGAPSTAGADELPGSEGSDGPAFIVATAKLGAVFDLVSVLNVNAGGTVELNVWDDLYVGLTGSFNVRDEHMDMGNPVAMYFLSIVGPIVRYRARVAPHFQIAPFVGVVGVAQMEIVGDWGSVDEHDPLAFHGGLQLAFTEGAFIIGAEADVTPFGYSASSIDKSETVTDTVVPVNVSLVVGAAF